LAEIADTTTAPRRSIKTTVAPRVSVATRENNVLPALTAIPTAQWHALAERAIEPNGYYLADWELAVSTSARGRTNASALAAWDHPAAGASNATGLTALLPVVSLWRAYRIPLPVLVSADPYGSLGTPLLDRMSASDSAAALMNQARRAGAHALILRDITLDGGTLKAFTSALAEQHLKPHVLQSHARACLDATGDPDQLLRDALGAKKLKELRRQRNRLADHGDVVFHVARTPNEVAQALEIFLTLEMSGWKGERGTALAQDAGDAAFIRFATIALAAHGQCEIISLQAGTTPVAAAVVLRHQDRAFYFKLGVDETFAKFSPGVQLTLELTRHLCADPTIAMADSTANAGHSMIEPIWRGRLAIGDVLIPLRRYDPVIPAVYAALALRKAIREPVRRAVHFIRKRQEKST
jgi:CelD/BcsL family acetyltransferase involved in cellulose biosynthesis